MVEQKRWKGDSGRGRWDSNGGTVKVEQWSLNSNCKTVMVEQLNYNSDGRTLKVEQ